MKFDATDVRCAGTNAACPCGQGSDYTGKLLARAPVRMTDKANGPGENENGTVVDTLLEMPVTCVGTGAATIGATLRAQHDDRRADTGRRARGQARDLATRPGDGPRRRAERHRLRRRLPDDLRRRRRAHVPPPGDLRAVAEHGTTSYLGANEAPRLTGKGGSKGALLVQAWRCRSRTYATSLRTADCATATAPSPARQPSYAFCAASPGSRGSSRGRRPRACACRLEVPLDLLRQEAVADGLCHLVDVAGCAAGCEPLAESSGAALRAPAPARAAALAPALVVATFARRRAVLAVVVPVRSRSLRGAGRGGAGGGVSRGRWRPWCRRCPCRPRHTRPAPARRRPERRDRASSPETDHQARQDSQIRVRSRQSAVGWPYCELLTATATVYGQPLPEQSRSAASCADSAAVGGSFAGLPSASRFSSSKGSASGRSTRGG